MSNLSFNQPFVDTETRVIGALLVINHEASLGKALDALTEDMFTDVENRCVFTAIKELYVNDRVVGFAGVCAQLAAKGMHLDNRKAYSYQGQYNNSFYLDKDIETLTAAKIVRDVKTLIPALKDFVKNPASFDANIYSRLTGLQRQFNEIGATLSDPGDNAYDLIDELLASQDLQKEQRVYSGYQDLDEITHGFAPGSLNIIAARTGVGKTTAALDIVRNVSFKDMKTCVFFALEMTKNELMSKILSAQLEIPLNKFITHTLTGEDKRLIKEFQDEHQTAISHLHVNDDSHVTIDMLELKIPALVRENNVALIVIDYLQLIGNKSRSKDNRAAEVGDVSVRLKKIAKNCKIPIIALAQLNRTVESRANKTPTLADIRESGSIEQDADLVIMLRRGEEDDGEEGLTHVSVVKNRHGEQGSIIVGNDLLYSRFKHVGHSTIQQTPVTSAHPFAGINITPNGSYYQNEGLL